MTRPGVLGLVLLLGVSSAWGQSTLERTPNLAGGWVGDAGVAQFHFLHRFNHSGAPQRQVQSRPTFLLAYTPVPRLLAGVRYTTRSALVAGVPNEWEAFARFRTQLASPVALGLQLGYNQAARSADAELSAATTLGPIRPIAAVRVLGSDGDRSETAVAMAAGVVLRVHEHVALAADAGHRFSDSTGERISWGAGLQFRIPNTPHTLSLQAANTDATTLQSASRAGNRVRWGFEFTVPITPARYFGGSPAHVATAGDTTAVIRGLQFLPSRLHVKAGTVIAWRNEDPLEHSVSAVDRSWDSGQIAPGSTWSRRFDVKGEHAIFCTPHPFMRAVVVVE